MTPSLRKRLKSSGRTMRAPTMRKPFSGCWRSIRMFLEKAQCLGDGLVSDGVDDWG